MFSSIKKLLKKTLPYYRKREEFFEFSKQKISELKNSYKGKRCFIIGNGPSLKISDLDKLSNEFTFASNKIYLAFDSTEWRPTFYNCEDDLVLKQNVDDISHLTGFIKFMPDFAYSLYKDIKDIIYYEPYVVGDIENPLMDERFPGFSNDLTQSLNWGSTVVYSQLQFAAYFGFTQIYLLGVDLDYTVPMYKVDGAYYSDGEINHFHKDYRKPGELWNKPNLDVHLASFTYAKQILKSRDILIQNATRGGNLELFPRVSLDKLIGEKI